ncbi:hypothetical protein AMELA_G00023340, partial [Ameiurus melas]
AVKHVIGQCCYTRRHTSSFFHRQQTETENQLYTSIEYIQHRIFLFIIKKKGYNFRELRIEATHCARGRRSFRSRSYPESRVLSKVVLLLLLSFLVFKSFKIELKSSVCSPVYECLQIITRRRYQRRRHGAEIRGRCRARRPHARGAARAGEHPATQAGAAGGHSAFEG